MNLSDVIAIALGLAFTYALLSLLASTLQEAIASLLQKRAKEFKTAISTILDSGTSNSAGIGSLAARVYGHAFVSGLSRANQPSYLPARNFTLALFDVLSAGSQSAPVTALERAVSEMPAGPVRQTLQTLTNDAAGNIDVLKASVDKWFDDAMDRFSGNYKRWAQLILFVVGFCLAVGLDVDTIKIVSTLEHDSAVRAALAQQAADAAIKPNEVASTDDLLRRLSALPVPIGWSFCVDEKAAGTSDSSPLCSTVLWRLPLTHAVITTGNGWSFLVVVVGWVLTAIAISFGAPFWFDLLNQLVNLRAAGPKPPRADEQ